MVTIITEITIAITEEEGEEDAAVDTQMQDLSLGPMEESLKYMPHIIFPLKYGMRSHMPKGGESIRKGNSTVQIRE